MKTIVTISQNVFKKALRSKIFGVILFFTLGLLLISRLLESLTFTAQTKLVKDIGLASISFFTVLISIFIGGESICGEIERKTIYIPLSKPVSRVNFILGEFLGVIWANLLTLIISSSIFFLILFLGKHKFTLSIFEALFFIFLEAGVVASIAVMFSSFTSSSTISILLSFFVYVLGHLHSQLSFWGEEIKSIIGRGIIRIISWVLPNLEYFNIRKKVVEEIPVSSNYIGKVALYGLLYIFVMLIITCLIFNRRELQ
ncbi:ABC transporter permease [Candidatus Aerophobetes bacterium]|nr:ABC transporter permease [Candidatus Aerophobetes bacterium]